MIIVIQVFVTLPTGALVNKQPEQPCSTPAPANPLQPVCPQCGWTKVYNNIRSARNALAGHKQHCAGAERYKSPFSRPVSAVSS